jgi:hypothetical protein
MYDGVLDFSAFDAAALIILGAFIHIFFAIFVLIAFLWRMYDGVVDYSAFDAATLLTIGAFYHAFFVMPRPETVPKSSLTTGPKKD